MKEEAGFDCQPITLLLIQEQGPQWIRFIFLARITGQRSRPLRQGEEGVGVRWAEPEGVLPVCQEEA